MKKVLVESSGSEGDDAAQAGGAKTGGDKAKTDIERRQWAPRNSRWTEFENVLLVKMRTRVVSENMMAGGVVKNANVWDLIATRSMFLLCTVVCCVSWNM